MSATRRRDTRPELALRSALHRLGLRFRVDRPIPLPGRRPVRPDVVFGSRRLCVFIDGCFWHRCPVHGTAPTRNTAYWGPKLARNVARDTEIDEALGVAGWTVIRVWEHENASDAAMMIARALRAE
jgi:DNA mismatch endonuclease (patch repair protein)